MAARRGSSAEAAALLEGQAEQRDGELEAALPALSQARQRAQDALLLARLEGRSPRAVALARRRAQRAADLLLAARLAAEARKSARFSAKARGRGTPV